MQDTIKRSNSTLPTAIFGNYNKDPATIILKAASQLVTQDELAVRWVDRTTILTRQLYTAKHVVYFKATYN